MFSTKKAKEYNQTLSKFLSVGIHENVDIESVKLGTSPNKGSKFIEIVYVKDGQTVTKTEWEPQRWGNQTDKEFDAKNHNFIGRLQQILECYYDANDPAIECECETFDQLANWFINLINNRDKSVLVRLKVVYNKDGYTCTPDYSKYAFIEPMSADETWFTTVKREKMVIRSNDKMERPIVADKVQTVANPFQESTSTSVPEFGESTSTQEVKEELPF